MEPPRQLYLTEREQSPGAADELIIQIADIAIFQSDLVEAAARTVMETGQQLVGLSPKQLHGRRGTRLYAELALGVLNCLYAGDEAEIFSSYDGLVAQTAQVALSITNPTTDPALLRQNVERLRLICVQSANSVIAGVTSEMDSQRSTDDPKSRMRIARQVIEKAIFPNLVLKDMTINLAEIAGPLELIELLRKRKIDFVPLRQPGNS